MIDLSHGIVRHDVGQGAVVLANALGYSAPGGSPRGGRSRRRHRAPRGRGGRRRARSGCSSGPTTGCSRSRSSGSAGPPRRSTSPTRRSASSRSRRPSTAAICSPRWRPTWRSARRSRSSVEPLDPTTLRTIDRGEPTIEPGLRLEAEVGHVDAFGNLSLIATAADADDAGLEVGKGLRVRGPRRSDEAVYALTFADAEPGAMVLLRRLGALARARGQPRRRIASRGAAPTSCERRGEPGRLPLSADVSRS